MKILYTMDARYARAGGVTKYLQCVLEHLSDECCPYDWSLTPGVKISSVRQSGFGINVLRMCRATWTAVRFNRLLKMGGIDLVHLNPSLGKTAVMRDIRFARQAHLAGIPFVVFFHGWNKDYERFLEARGKTRELQEAFGKANRIFVLASEFKAKLVEWGFDGGRIVVETTMFDDSISSDFDIESRLQGITANRSFNMLFISRLERKKGLEAAIQTQALLQRRGCDTRLIVAGEGTLRAQSEAYVQEHSVPGVTFAGFVSGREKVLAFMKADLLLFPTHGEGLPITLLEAMAMGLPVLTRPVGGIPDFFVDDRMGKLTESLDPADYASWISALIPDIVRRREIARRNYEYAQEHFRASVVTRRLEEVYRQVLAEHRVVPCCI